MPDIKTPWHARSIYDPSHRQVSKSALHAANYGGGTSGLDWKYYQQHIRPSMFPEPERVYTQEQHDAFAAAIEGLCVQYPVYGWNRGARKRTKARFAAIRFAKEGSKNEAFARAVYGAIPKDALRAVEALIYG